MISSQHNSETIETGISRRVEVSSSSTRSLMVRCLIQPKKLDFREATIFLWSKTRLSVFFFGGGVLDTSKNLRHSQYTQWLTQYTPYILPFKL